VWRRNDNLKYNLIEKTGGAKNGRALGERKKVGGLGSSEGVVETAWEGRQQLLSISLLL